MMKKCSKNKKVTMKKHIVDEMMRMVMSRKGEERKKRIAVEYDLNRLVVLFLCIEIYVFSFYLLLASCWYLLSCYEKRAICFDDH